MYPKVRLWIYITACVLAVLVFFLVMFSVVTTAAVVEALPFLALVYAAIMALAAKNVSQ